MDLNEAFDGLRLDLIPESWVQSIWVEDFSGESELPPEYELQLESADYLEMMTVLAEAVRIWLEEDTESVNSLSISFGGSRGSITNKKTWQCLLSRVDHKALMCFISTFLRQDARSISSVESMLLALTASRLYLALLAINGSHIYQIFNSLLYSQAMESFKVANVLVNSNRPVSQKKGPGRKKAHAPTGEEEPQIVPVSQKDKADILNSLEACIDELQYCLKTLSLKDEEDSLTHTVQAFVTLTRLERSKSNFLDCHVASGSVTSLAQKSYRLLLSLCTGDNGDRSDVIRTIVITLVPALVESEQPVPNMTPKEVGVIREHTIHFLNSLVSHFPKESFPSVKALMQQLCIRVPDKSEIRTRCVLNIIEMLNVLPAHVYNSVVAWIVSMCHAEIVRHRVTAIELLAKLVTIGERPSKGDGGQEDASRVLAGHKFILTAILSRMCDISPTVRAKSLSIFGTLIHSRNPSVHSMIEHIFVTSCTSVETNKVGAGERGWFDLKSFFSKKPTGRLEADPLPSGTFLVRTLETLVEDEKVFVRKNALHALCNIYTLNPNWITAKRLDVLVTSCKDISVAVRKMLVQCLTDLVLEYPNHEELPKCWVQAIIPLIGDNEVKCQEKVLETLENVILNNLVAYKNTNENEPLHLLPWKLLTIISNLGLRRLFRYACKQWTLKNRIKDQMFSILRSHIGTQNNLPAWFLLVCLTEFQDMPAATFVLDYYYDNVHNAPTVDEYCSQLVLEGVHLNWRQTGGNLHVDLCAKLKQCIETFSVPLPLIARSIDICHLIDPENIKPWGENLIRVCENYLKKTIRPGCSKTLPNEEVFIQYVFTIGELAQFCLNAVSKYTIKLLTKLIDPDYDDPDGEERWDGVVSDRVRAITVATVGKLCLQDQFLAKELVSSLGGMLTNQWQSSVKINTVVALSDLCVRFTSLIEAYLGDMCVCLRDTDIVVRTNTLTYLTQLIQEDFLKLRYPFFYYILFMLEDEVSSIREQTSAFLVNTILAKHPSIMYQHFLQAVFFYNDYENHRSHNNVVLSPQERAAFCMPGEGGRECRRKLYRYMLDHMQDDHRFKVTYRLCTEILDEVSEGKIRLNQVGTFVLQDALYILSCDEIRMVHLRSGKETHEDDNGEMMEEVITHVRKTIISQLVKKNYIENIVPIIIRLKHKLKEMKSSLVRDLMICLRELMKDFKEEINEILAADPELASEVALDLKLTEQDEEALSYGSREEEEEDEELAQRREQLSHLMKEARIECVRLSEEVLQNGGINLGSPPRDDCGIDFEALSKTPPRANIASPSGSTSGASGASTDSGKKKRGRKRNRKDS